jgi:hypothetical protein
VLVLGASGALVTATVENGVATVKVSPATESSATTVAGTTTTATTHTTSTNTTVNQILSLFNRTKAEKDPTGTAIGKDCADAPKALTEQIKRVNDAFKKDHEAIRKLAEDAPRTDAAKTAVKNAEKAIKDIRQAAVKGIHATAPATTSAKCDPEDNDVEEDEGANHDMKHEADEDKEHEDEDEDTVVTPAATTVTPTTPSIAFSGTEAKAIADLAISAMDLQVTNLKADLAKLPKTAATTTTTNKTEKAKSDHKSSKANHENKDKGQVDKND